MDGTDRVLYFAPEHDTKIAGLYNIQHTIGRGHYAVVKLAQHVFTGEKVAVKVIDKTKLDSIARDHLFQEVVCMKLVQHPNVVRLYEVIDTPNKLYLILELGDGGDLYDYIMKHGRGLDERVAKRYFRQIVTAIAYCHKLHVVHRDLKPENVVFFEKLGLVKLTDFGFSNKFIPGTHLDTHCGSLAYSAPEILLGDPYDAPKVDVWSLGVILFMLVCGRLPFEEANDSETLTKIMDCEYTIPNTVSLQCASLIKRLLVSEPEQRAGLDGVLQDDWLHVEDHDLPIELFSVPLVSRECLSFEDHMEILAKMSEGQLATVDEIQSTLDNNEYNHIAATYYLLAERKLKRNFIEEYKRLSHQAMLSEKCIPLQQQQPQAPSQPANDLLMPSTAATGASRSTGITPAHEDRVRRVSMILEDEEEEEKEEAVERVRLQQAKRQRLSFSHKSHSLSSWRFGGDDVSGNAAEDTVQSVDGVDTSDVYSSCCLVEPSQEALLAEEEEELVTVASLAMVRSDLLPDQSSMATAAVSNVSARSTNVASAVNGGSNSAPITHTRPHSRGSISDGTESDLSLGNLSGYAPSNITGSLYYVSPTARSLPPADVRRRVAVYRRGNVNHRPLVTVKSSPQLLKHIMEEDRSAVNHVDGIREDREQQTSDQYIRGSDSNTASMLIPALNQRDSSMSVDEQVTRVNPPQLQRLSSLTIHHPTYLVQQRPKTMVAEISRSTTHSPSRTRRFFTSPSSASHPSRPLSMGSWNIIGDFQRQQSTSTSPVEPINPLPTIIGGGGAGLQRRKPTAAASVRDGHGMSISDRRCSGPPALMLALYNRYHSVSLPPGANWSRLARSRSGSTSSCIGEGNRGVFELSVSEFDDAQNGERDALPSITTGFDAGTTPNHVTGDSVEMANGGCRITSTDSSTKGKVPTIRDPPEKEKDSSQSPSNHTALDSFSSPHKAASWCSSTPLLCDENCSLQGGSDSVRHCATPPLSIPIAYPVSPIPLGMALREILCTPIREEDDEHCRTNELIPLGSLSVQQPGLSHDTGRSHRHRRRSESSAQARPVSAFCPPVPLRSNSALPSAPLQPNQNHLSSPPGVDLQSTSVRPTTTLNSTGTSIAHPLVASGPEDHYLPSTATTTALAVSSQFYGQPASRHPPSFTTSNFSLSSLAVSMRDSRHMLDVVRGVFELQCYYQRRSASTTAHSVTDGHSVDGLSGNTSVSASVRSLTALFENFPLKSGLSGDALVPSNPRRSQFNSTGGLPGSGQVVSRFLEYGSGSVASSQLTTGEQGGFLPSTSKLLPAYHLPSVNETLNDGGQVSGRPTSLGTTDFGEPVTTSTWQSTTVAHLNRDIVVNSSDKIQNTFDRLGSSQQDIDNARKSLPVPAKCRFPSLSLNLMHQLPRLLFQKSHRYTTTPTGRQSPPVISSRENTVDPKVMDNQKTQSMSPVRHLSPGTPAQGRVVPSHPTACLVVFDKDGDLNVLPRNAANLHSDSNNNNCNPDLGSHETSVVATPDRGWVTKTRPYSRLRCCIIS